MMQTLTDYLVESERKYPMASGNFTLLMLHLESAVKSIASHIRLSGLSDLMGKTGGKNAYGDEVEKLDDFANSLLKDTLLNSGQVYAVGSEELEKEEYSKHGGDYIVFFDPVDGSSNIDTNIAVGTIFSIYHKGDSGELLQKGRNQVASGYVIYGSSVMFVCTFGDTVQGFTLDPSSGIFLLTHPNMRVPEKGSYYAINEACYPNFDSNLQAYVDSFKEEGSKYKLRYIGSMVADVHRTLLKGGVFLYPADKKQPQGKLRLLYEVNPMSFLFEKAGGVAVSSGNKSSLDIAPESLADRSPIVLGGKYEVEKYIEMCDK